MQYGVGYFDHETCRVEPVENPFREKVLTMCPYMDSSSFASPLLEGDEVRLLTYIRPLELAYVDAGP